MNKTSNVAFDLAQDIYNLSGDVDSLFDQHRKNEITNQHYFKKLYVHACEANFLDGVVHAVKSEGYKFARYEKEIELLNSVLEDISENLDMAQVCSLKNIDIKNLSHLINKYKSIVPIDEISEELSEI